MTIERPMFPRAADHDAYSDSIATFTAAGPSEAVAKPAGGRSNPAAPPIAAQRDERLTGLPAASAAKPCLPGQPASAERPSSRRSFVISAAALPLVVTPAIAAAPRDGIPYDLAARFTDFYGRWLEQRRRDAAEREAFEGALKVANSGEWGSWIGEYDTDRHGGGREAPCVSAWRDPDLLGWNRLNAELEVLSGQIMGCRPSTVDDLVLQARACALMNHEMWTDSATIEAVDAGVRAQRQILEGVAALAGAELLPGVATVALV